MENDTVEKLVKANYHFVDNKAKAKNYYQTNKEKLQKTLWEYNRNLSEDEKLKKRNYASSRYKNMSDIDNKERKIYIKTYYFRRKNVVKLLNS